MDSQLFIHYFSHVTTSSTAIYFFFPSYLNDSKYLASFFSFDVLLLCLKDVSRYLFKAYQSLFQYVFKKTHTTMHPQLELSSNISDSKSYLSTTSLHFHCFNTLQRSEPFALIPNDAIPDIILPLCNLKTLRLHHKSGDRDSHPYYPINLIRITFISIYINLEGLFFRFFHSLEYLSIIE